MDWIHLAAIKYTHEGKMQEKSQFLQAEEFIILQEHRVALIGLALLSRVCIDAEQQYYLDLSQWSQHELVSL